MARSSCAAGCDRHVADQPFPLNTLGQRLQGVCAEAGTPPDKGRIFCERRRRVAAPSRGSGGGQRAARKGLGQGLAERTVGGCSKKPRAMKQQAGGGDMYMGRRPGGVRLPSACVRSQVDVMVGYQATVGARQSRSCAAAPCASAGPRAWAEAVVGWRCERWWGPRSLGSSRCPCHVVQPAGGGLRVAGA